MKKLLFFLMILSVHNLNAQTQKTREGIDDNPPNCPPGTCPTFYVNLEIFNFHKPKTDCTSGFGLCIRLASGVTCERCLGKSSLENGKLSVFGKLNEQTVELHFPQEIQNEKGFEDADFKTFEIEDNTFSLIQPDGKILLIPGGTYPVKQIDNEYVVEMPIQ
ncbi:MAG: hypothetical protein NT127_04825 [Sphingobacteriales bacterium]|nr:hypothetical protein [Sphingobacteriales bacterium]